MKKVLSIFSLAVMLNSSAFGNALTLNKAMEILRANNLEIKIAKLDQNIANKDKQVANGNYYGKLDFIQDFANSDDAGNAFGFKITSREATLQDFDTGQMTANETGGVQMKQERSHDNLNYPDSRSFFQSKIKWEVPLYTGFKITSYVDIMDAMARMKKLEKSKVVNEKMYELRKSFYDMALLQSSSKNLNNILNNIHKLEVMTKNMIDVGYAKRVDLLEVQAKKGNVERYLMDMKLNKKLLYHYISFLLNKKVTDIVLPKSSVAMPQLSTKEIIDENIDIKRATLGLKIRKSMINISKADLYHPMAGGFVEFATADDTFLGDASDHKAYTVGARLTWNIYNGGIDTANLQKAKIEYLKTKTQVQLAQKGIGLQVAKIKTEIQSYDEKINFLEKELRLANEIYHNYEARYIEKLASMSDVIIKQSGQIQKILELQMVKNKRNERIFALEKLANGDK